MKDKVKACPGKELKQMATDQLDALLQTELQKEHPDESVVLPILQELQEREKDYPVKIPEGIEERMTGYRDRIHTVVDKPKRKRTKTIRIAAVAAVVCIVLMAIPRTVGAESVFQVLHRWTEDFFEFLSPGGNNDNPTVEYRFETDNEGLKQLHDVMVAEGVTNSVVPTWLPEGYELLEIKTEAVSDTKKVFAKFRNGTKEMLVSYKINQKHTTTKYERGISEASEYEINGVTHYIIENEENISIVWMSETIESIIVVNEENEIVRRIISSIYLEG